MIRPGDWVMMPALPPLGVAAARRVAGRLRALRRPPYRVAEITPDGQLVLDVSGDIDARFGGYQNDLRVEPELVRPVEPPTAE